MDLGTIISGLKTQAQGSKCKAMYEEARGAHEALGPYATRDALFEAMGEAAAIAPTAEARKQIVVVLVAEHRKAAHPMWTALLVRAFEPMLKRLRRKMSGNGDDADQRVVMAFLQAVGRVPELEDPGAVAGYLRIATERALFAAMQEEWTAPETEPFVERTHPTGEGMEERLVGAIDLQRVLASEPNARELADVLAATCEEGDSLWAYVDRTHTGLPTSERNRVYRRLQQQRNRLMRRLRVRLGEESPALVRRLVAA